MALILFLLGTILFLPYYSAALEVRLKLEKEFQPFRIVKNLRVGSGGRYALPVFGLILIFLGFNVYLFSEDLAPVTDGDIVRVVLVVVLTWCAFFYGYAKREILSREVQRVDDGRERIKCVRADSRISCALKALGDIFIVCAVFVLFFVLKSYVLR
ncbi:MULTISPECIES: hypothetical protein [unclassified Pseudomonas]|uniref:hypothetical protein n=1 Tax=unclassified Pseudomonas TaxID=196821 RepID=UPI00128D5239|nr:MULTISPECIES: hypothetical protein [unclassified Pseudomonas]MPQ68112.1 hypothetical protein [Pseudomonas sp. MWU12-2323]